MVSARFVLVGHSERRHGNIASETDAEINAKIRKVPSGLILPSGLPLPPQMRVSVAFLP